MNDIITPDAFGVVNLTKAMEILPSKPGRVSGMGLFGDEGVTTLTVVLEFYQGVISVLHSLPRGAPGQSMQKGERLIRSLPIPHFPVQDALLADDVQGVRAFGSENRTETVSDRMNRKLKAIKQSFETTFEYLKSGALQGIVYDGNGKVLANLFDLFDVQEKTFDFKFSTSTTRVREIILNVKRHIERALGVAIFDHVHALCGKEWFSTFIEHEAVKYAYERWQDGRALRDDPRGGFEFAGVIFEEYDAQIGEKPFIPVDVARFFPVGTPQLCKTYYGPANYNETVNTVGRPLYAKTEKMKFDKGYEIEAQSNAIPVCHRPNVLVKGTKS